MAMEQALINVRCYADVPLPVRTAGAIHVGIDLGEDSFGVEAPAVAKRAPVG